MTHVEIQEVVKEAQKSFLYRIVPVILIPIIMALLYIGNKIAVIDDVVDTSKTNTAQINLIKEDRAAVSVTLAELRIQQSFQATQLNGTLVRLEDMLRNHEKYFNNIWPRLGSVEQEVKHMQKKEEG